MAPDPDARIESPGLRLVFMGCVESSHAFLSKVLELPEARLVGVVTRRRSAFHSDFRSLEPLARRCGAPCFFDERNDQAALLSWLADLAPDVVYCFGWPYLLRREILAVPPLGVVGYHPAPLPRFRGRHPIIWALALGLERTASSFLILDEGADSGDLVSQVPVAIEPHDDAGSLYAKLVEVGCRQVETLTRQLAAGTLRRQPQDAGQATLWRRRSADDGRIDWRMSARGVHNLVRALARPYPGAHFVHRGRPVKVWRTRLGLGGPGVEPGKVLSVVEGLPLVACGEDALWLVEHELGAPPAAGEYL